MTPKNTNHYNVNTSSEHEPSTLFRGQLIQQVADVQRQLSEKRTLANREWELAASRRDTTECEQEAVTQISRQLLTQIKAFWKAQEWIIELGVREAQMDAPSQAHQHLYFWLTYVSS